MPTLSERVRAYVAEIDANSKPSIPDDYPGFARELAEAADAPAIEPPPLPAS